ncbi:MAG: glycosyltransferase family 87 protein [Acidothermaceae bacterium]
MDGLDPIEAVAPQLPSLAPGGAAATVRDAVTVEPTVVGRPSEPSEPSQLSQPGHHGWRQHRWHGPGMVRRAFHGGRRAPVASALALVVLAAALWPMLSARLFEHPAFRMSDLEVYRSAGESLIYGRPLYDYLTPVPQLLPFTYPPFSAIVALPLALMGSLLTNWVWTLGSLAVLGWITLVSFRPFVRRFPSKYRPFLVVGALTAMAWTLPARDCFHFGQVGIFLVALCLLDCVLPKTRWPRGILIGFAAAIKLVPGVFIPYLWLTGRRRAAVVATAWFVGFSAATAIAMPSASKKYWTGTLFESGRLGNNAGTSNQALRGMFLRWLPGHLGSVLWVVSVVVVTIFAYRWARSASNSGFEVRGVAIVGLLSVLISPVSWIHHLAGWVPLLIGVLLGDGRDWRRVGCAVLATAFFILQIPWYGSTIVAKTADWHVPGRILESGFGLAALFAVWLLGRMESRSKGQTSATRKGNAVSR